jgi:hypothetical protein
MVEGVSIEAEMIYSMLRRYFLVLLLSHIAAFVLSTANERTGNRLDRALQLAFPRPTWS